MKYFHYHNGIIKHLFIRASKHKISRFAVIGVFNTLTDIVLLNILRVLTHTQTTQTTRLIALNIISASLVAMMSFALNRKYVFKADDVENKMFLPFLIITLIGIYIIQSIIIGASLKTFDPLAEKLMEIGKNIPLVKDFTFNFYEANIAKIFATLGSVTWNYIMYNRFVFNKKPKTTGSS